MTGVKRIGLIGEDPSDKEAIKNLLLQKYKHEFIPLLKHQTGDNLESPKTKRMLSVELEKKKLDLIIFIRDLDAFESDNMQVQKRMYWFQKLNKQVQTKSLLLLHIYELEALILADVAAFNKIFKTDIVSKADPMLQVEPKEMLKRKTAKSNRKFKESDNPEVFQNLNFEEVMRRCRYFKNFIVELDEVLTS